MTLSKKTKIVIIVFTAIIIAMGIFLAFKIINDSKESSIKSEIKKANYCEVDSDCIDAGGQCPFGCYIYVNKNEVNRISQLVQSFNSKCVYDCISDPVVTCENKKCKEVLER